MTALTAGASLWVKDGDSFVEFDASTADAGTYTLTVKLTAGTDTFTAGETLEVTLSEDYIASITASVNKNSDDNEKTWTVGDSFGADDITVTATWASGSKTTLAVTEDAAQFSLASESLADGVFTGSGTVTVTVTELVTETESDRKTCDLTVTVAAGDVYVLTEDSAQISLEKSQFGTIASNTVETGKAYLAAATDNWLNNKTKYTVNDVTYEDVYYNLASTARSMTVKVKNVSAFKVYVQNSSKGRQYTVTVGENLLGTITHTGSGIEDSPLFTTNSTDEVTIKLGNPSSSSSSVYPICMVFYSEAGALSVAKTEWETLKTSVAEIKETDYWSGYADIVAKRDITLSDSPTLSEYGTAISELQAAIDAAVAYVAPTAITVKQGDEAVDTTAGISINTNNFSGDSIKFTASEDSGSTGKLTWSVEGITDITGTESDDGATYTISGISSDHVGTATVTVKDTDSRAGTLYSTGVSFSLVISASAIKLTGESVVSITPSAETFYSGDKVTLTATAKTGDDEVSEELTYQWYKGGTEDGNKIADATSATYTIDEVTSSDAGSYFVKVSSTSYDTGVASSAYELAVTETVKYFDYTTGKENLAYTATDSNSSILTGGNIEYDFCTTSIKDGYPKVGTNANATGFQIVDGSTSNVSDGGKLIDYTFTVTAKTAVTLGKLTFNFSCGQSGKQGAYVVYQKNSDTEVSTESAITMADSTNKNGAAEIDLSTVELAADDTFKVTIHHIMKGAALSNKTPNVVLGQVYLSAKAK